MNHRHVPGTLALVTVTVAVMIVRGANSSPVMRTLDVNAVLITVDTRAGIAIVAGNAGGRGRLILLDVRSGAILHTIALKGSVSPGDEGDGFVPPSILSIDAPAHRAYVTRPGYGTGATSRGLLSVVDTQHGTLVRTVSLALPPVALAVDRHAGRVFVVTAANAAIGVNRNRGDVIALDARSGAIVREDVVSAGPLAVAVDEYTGHAFVALQSTDTNGIPLGPGTLQVRDSLSGRVLRTVAIGQNPFQVIVSERDHHVFSLGVSEQAPYLGRLTMVDARSGTVLRTTAVGSIPSSVILDEKRSRTFIMNSGDGPGLGSVSVVDTRSGALVQTIALPDTPQAMALSPMATAAGLQDHLFIAISNNANRTCATGPSRLLMIGLAGRSGPMGWRILRTTALGLGPRAMAVDERTSRVFVVTVGDADPIRACIPTGNGAVTVLDARTGNVVRTMAVGVAPAAITVDEQAGRAFILNAGGMMSVHASDPCSWLPRWARYRLPFISAVPSGVHEQVAPASVTVLDVTQVSDAG